MTKATSKIFLSIFWIFTFFPIKNQFLHFFLQKRKSKKAVYTVVSRGFRKTVWLFLTKNWRKFKNSRKKIKIQKIEQNILGVALVMIWKKKNSYHEKNIFLCSCEKKQILNLIKWSTSRGCTSKKNFRSNHLQQGQPEWL